jgi:hypothetical protein
MNTSTPTLSTGFDAIKQKNKPVGNGDHDVLGMGSFGE